MKRQTIALLVQPFKNRLMPHTTLSDSIDHFCKKILELATAFPHLRLNCGLPAYILEQANVLYLSKIRDLFKTDTLELITTGYTEPFLSLSPLSLTRDNINHGQNTFLELTGQTPTGYLPPFSNWEPSIIETLRESGLNYAVLAQELFPQSVQNNGGYWTAEHAGNSISIFPSVVIQSTNAPVDFIDWLEKLYQNIPNSDSEKLLTIQYLVPLNPLRDVDPYRWLQFAASELDKHLLNFQPVRFSDFLTISQPRGFQYIPSSMVTEAHGQADRHFLNYLYSHDQASVLQRKLVDVNDQLSACSDLKIQTSLKKNMFFVQDFNRLFPGKESGFTNTFDRLWSYGKLIEVENILDDKKFPDGGKVQVKDFFKNGSKIVILSNKHLKIYIDHKKGGQIFAFDHRDRLLNIAAAYSPKLHNPPDIMSPGISRTWFLDRILPDDAKGFDYAAGKVPYLSECHKHPFEYKISAGTMGVKALLIRNISFTNEERTYPLVIEKVFGLEKNSSIFTFVYQLTNPSLMPYQFKFTTELNFSFPSCATNDLSILNGSTVYEKPGCEFTQIEGTTKWAIEDQTGGLHIHFQTQKPMDIWCIPPDPSLQNANASQGLTTILSSQVVLNPNSHWKMIGKIVLRKHRKKGTNKNVS